MTSIYSKAHIQHMFETFSVLDEVQFPIGTIITIFPSTLTPTHPVFNGYRVPFLGLVRPEFNPNNIIMFFSTLTRLALRHTPMVPSSLHKPACARSLEFFFIHSLPFQCYIFIPSPLQTFMTTFLSRSIFVNKFLL